MQIPGTVFTTLATLIIFIASYFFKADQVGTAVSAAVTLALAVLKAWQVQQPGDDNAISTRGTASAPSKTQRFFLG